MSLREAKTNKGKEGRTQVVVVVKISRRIEASMRPPTTDREKGKLKMRDSDETPMTESL